MSQLGMVKDLSVQSWTGHLEVSGRVEFVEFLKLVEFIDCDKLC
jgi:hypothetical protein